MSPNSTNRKFKKEHYFSRGLSDRAFIMTISVLTFFVFLTVGLVMVLFQQEINDVYLDLLDMAKAPLMIIIGSVFAVEGIETVTNRKTKQELGSIVQEHIDCKNEACQVTDEVMDSMFTPDDKV